jgi:hypothetical protein
MIREYKTERKKKREIILEYLNNSPFKQMSLTAICRDCKSKPTEACEELTKLVLTGKVTKFRNGRSVIYRLA